MEVLKQELELEQAIRAGGLLLVQFGAETCVPRRACFRFQPFLSMLKVA